MAERPNRSRRRRLASVIAALVVTGIALAGCAGIPSSGTVNAGEVTTDRNPELTPLSSGPQKDSTQAEILTDFMQAATSPETNYQVARQYLTAAAAASWVPTKSVLIRDAPAAIRTIDGTDLGYSVLTSASVNAFGVYQQNQQASQPLSFSFKKVDGQWRISELADGTVLSRESFDAVFSSYTLYYYDPSYRFLIPDMRWFPKRSDVPTRIVTALLSGQAAWLQQGATLTAFPQGTQLATVPVEVKSGVAVVDLSDEAGTANALEKARMLRQLRSSLGNVLTVSSPTMTVRGAPLSVPDPGIASPSQAPSVNPLPLVRTKTKFGFAGTDGISTIPKLSANVVALDPTGVALARGEASAAVLSATGVSLVTTSGSKLLDNRPGLIEPSIDNSGFVWSVPGTNAAGLRAIGADGVAHAISTDLPRGARIVAFQISHDGARALAYLQTANGPRLEVAAILRRGLVPTGLGQMVELPTSGNAAIDATWLDESTVATLSRSASGEVVTSYPIGGPSTDLGRAANGAHLVGGNSVDLLRVLTSGDSPVILQRRASGWQSTGTSALVLATQQ